MSSVVLSGDSSGTVTLTVPAVAGTNTVTVPASTGTVALLQTPSFTSTIGVGGATAASSGAGITFPATQSASSDANTLDDYEEGTWTPSITPQSGSLTAYSSSGRYTKIGNTVYISATFTITTAGTASGYVITNNYPFNANSAQSFVGSCRESASSGNVYTSTLQATGTSGYIFGNANGAIVWTNSYKYDWNFTYQV